MSTQAEFEALLRPHLDALYRTALRMTANEAAAEDLVQDVVLRAWRNLHRFEPGTHFRAWIFTILTNAYINEYRRDARAPILTDFTEAEPAAPEEAPALSAEDVERLGDRVGDSAKRALQKVPPEFRLIFLLATLEEMSYKEIAEIVGIPVGTVMSRLFRARKILRDELAAYAREGGFLKERNES